MEKEQSSVQTESKLQKCRQFKNLFEDYSSNDISLKELWSSDFITLRAVQVADGNKIKISVERGRL